jgi:hypothetical protein
MTTQEIKCQGPIEKLVRFAQHRTGKLTGINVLYFPSPWRPDGEYVVPDVSVFSGGLRYGYLQI